MTSATWRSHPGSNDYDTGTNWTGNVAPSDDDSGKAVFGASSVHSLTFADEITSIGSWIFTPQAEHYVFTLPEDEVLDFNSAGIVIDGGSATIDDAGDLLFDNGSSAGPSHIDIESDGGVTFADSSKAGTAHIESSGGIGFSGTASAAHAHIQVDQGDLSFSNSSTAGGAQIRVQSDGSMVLGEVSGPGEISTAGHANIQNSGFLFFTGSSTGGTAEIRNDALMQFVNDSNADHATITNDGTATFSDESTIGAAKFVNNGTVDFHNFSTDGFGSVLTTNKGATTSFHDDSDGGSARMITKTGGVVDFSDSLGISGSVAAGSIEGDGTYFLGADHFDVGSNNRSTEVTGLISDGGASGGTGAVLVKEGTGTLTLSHKDNAYTGGTDIQGGTLKIAALGAAGSGTISFDTNNQTLKLAQVAFSAHVFANDIDAMGIGDKIDLSGLKFTPHTHAILTGGTLSATIEVTNGSTHDTLDLSNLEDTVFKVKNDGHGGTLLVLQASSSGEKPEALTGASELTHDIAATDLSPAGGDLFHDFIS